MVTASREQVLDIQFFQPADKVKFSAEGGFYKRFQAEAKDHHGFALKLAGTWSINLPNGVGIDPQAPALALTARGIKEGTVAKFGKQGFFKMEIGVINNRGEIPDIEEVLLELKYKSRGRAKLYLFGSLPNLGTSQVGGVASGLIAIADIGEDKASTKGSVTKSAARIPGFIEQWKTEDGNVIYFMVYPDAVRLSHLTVDFTVVKR